MYIIKKTETESLIQYMEYDDPFYTLVIKPKDIIVNNLHIYDKKYLPKAQGDKMPFKYLFESLATKVFNLVYDDDDGDDDSNLTKMISEVDILLQLLNSEYKDLLSRDEYYSFIDKISFLKEELFNRMEINKYRRNLSSLMANRMR